MTKHENFCLACRKFCTRSRTFPARKFRPSCDSHVLRLRFAFSSLGNTSHQRWKFQLRSKPILIQFQFSRESELFRILLSTTKCKKNLEHLLLTLFTNFTEAGAEAVNALSSAHFPISHMNIIYIRVVTAIQVFLYNQFYPPGPTLFLHDSQPWCFD